MTLSEQIRNEIREVKKIAHMNIERRTKLIRVCQSLTDDQVEQTLEIIRVIRALHPPGGLKGFTKEELDKAYEEARALAASL